MVALVTPRVELSVVAPVTVKLSVISIVPPKESRIKLPALVSISLLAATPIRISSIVAPPLASRIPVNVEVPPTFRF